MHIISDLNEWMALRASLSDKESLGFVPTMGNLHAGHASLFLRSTAENKKTVSSLFVNPTQFNQQNDFLHYPRTLDADLELMRHTGVDYCLLPTQEALYADGYTYQVQENQLSQLMEGTFRPGHFNGVLTVVLKLLMITRPTNAYFGEKDFQQYLLIKNMVQAFFMNVGIKSCPTIREESGLAFSSRNNRLNTEQRERAVLFAQLFHQNKSSDLIKQELTEQGINVEYIEEFKNRRFAAVLIDDIRLIDNYLLA